MSLPLGGLRLAVLRYIPALFRAIIIIANLAGMFNENRTIL